MLVAGPASGRKKRGSEQAWLQGLARRRQLLRTRGLSVPDFLHLKPTACRAENRTRSPSGDVSLVAKADILPRRGIAHLGLRRGILPNLGCQRAGTSLPMGLFSVGLA